MKPPKYYEIMHVKCIEPVKRKHGSINPEWQAHRFPIKGGISWRDVMIHEMARPNPLFKLIKVIKHAQPRR